MIGPIGRWALNGYGELGIITGRNERGEYVGKRIDKGQWFSWKPQLLTEADHLALEALTTLAHQHGQW